MDIVVVGGGKVGYYLAKTLIDHGHQPRIVEMNKKVCTSLANNLDIPIIFGDGTTIETLERAGTDKADALIGVTGQDENNLICCQLAKKLFNVPKTVAKVNNPKNSVVMRRLGIDITINSTDNIAHLLEREVDNSRIKELINLNEGEATINEYMLPENYRFNGKRLSEIPIPLDSVIISIDRNGTIIIPRGATTLLSNDKLLIMSLNNNSTQSITKVLKMDE